MRECRSGSGSRRATGGRAGIRYPFKAEPWNWGTRDIEVRKDGRMLAPLRLRSSGGVVSGFPDGSVAPGDGSRKHWIPLHTRYRLDRAGDLRGAIQAPARLPEKRRARRIRVDELHGAALDGRAEGRVAGADGQVSAVGGSLGRDGLPAGPARVAGSRGAEDRRDYTRSTNNLISQYARHGLAYFEAARH